MTAEIAILNKAAVALAADSAVTISAGEREEKTFDTADKLFELCRHNSIGVMVYNGLSFAEAPLQSLIKKYRNECRQFETVKEAAFDFLEYLNSFGQRSSSAVRGRSVRVLIAPLLEQIANRFQSEVQQHFLQSKPETISTDAVSNVIAATLDKIIALFERIYEQAADAQFVGGNGVPDVTPEMEGILKEVIANRLPALSDEQKSRLLAITKNALRKNRLSPGATGIVIAGFGSRELFPTLISFEIDGMVGDRLKFVQENLIDIDRDGEKALVIPFAQKEMVDRFLYGLDDDIERGITLFCQRTVTGIRNAIFDKLQFPTPEDKKDFEGNITAAEDAFVNGLKKDAFDVIRSNSQRSIDAMVEFMPKPELAKMAEALVNLTSIKKRVTRGMDTVGGAIDVAVISQAEGFVWVKRKHYFPPDLNQRYVARVGERVRLDEESLHAQQIAPRSRARSRKADPKQ